MCKNIRRGRGGGWRGNKISRLKLKPDFVLKNASHLSLYLKGGREGLFLQLWEIAFFT